MRILLTLLLLTVVVEARGDRMRLEANSMTWGGTCDPKPYAVLAGSRLLVDVYCSADKAAEPLEPGWPKRYTLEVALDLPWGQPFMPSERAFAQLEPERYFDVLNKSADLMLRKQPEHFSEFDDLNTQHFVMTLPAELAGHTLTFRAAYAVAGTRIISDPSPTIWVVAPCSRADAARIIATRIYADVKAGDCNDAIAVADSMLEVNLSDEGGWYWARWCARPWQNKYERYRAQALKDFGRENPPGAREE